MFQKCISEHWKFAISLQHSQHLNPNVPRLPKKPETNALPGALICVAITLFNSLKIPDYNSARMYVNLTWVVPLQHTDNENWIFSLFIFVSDLSLSSENCTCSLDCTCYGQNLRITYSSHRNLLQPLELKKMLTLFSYFLKNSEWMYNKNGLGCARANW